MSLVLAAEFRAEYPDLAAPHDDPFIQGKLDEVEEVYCPADKWPGSVPRRKMAIRLRTAHILESRRLQMAYSSGQTVSVASGKGGGSFQQITDELLTTIYGKQFKELEEQVGTVSRIGFSLRKYGAW
jgi:hypothetical protein